MARIVVREKTSVRSLDQLIDRLQSLKTFYGNADISNLDGRDGVVIEVIEETLTDGSKVVDYVIH
jgi:hypothetical protein